MPGRTQPWRLLGLLALAALLGGAAAQAPSPAPLPSERPVPSVAAAPAAADAEADALAVEAAAPLDNSTDLYGGRTINICTSDYFPISRCLDRDAAEFTGYDMAIMERLTDRMGWAYDRLTWKCMDWYEMMASLEAGDGVCDIGAAGIEINKDWLAAGVAFSFPTLRGGFKVMVAAQGDASSYWYFLDAFSWQLWLAIVLTCFAVGGIVWAAERWAWIRPRAQRDLPSLEERLWQGLGRPMGREDMTADTFSANLIVIIFSFMGLILVTLYTSATTANLTAMQLQNRITSVADLPGRRVGTWTDYTTFLLQRNIDAIGYPWATEQDVEAMMADLRAGKLDAIVLDSYVMDYFGSTNCDVSLVGGDFGQYDQGLAFAAGTDPKVVNAVNEAVHGMKAQGVFELLQAQYIHPEARCKDSGVSESTSQVTFDQVTGLWILLAGTVLAALLIFAVSQMALCGARKVTTTKVFRGSVNALQEAGRKVSGTLPAMPQPITAIGSSITRLGGSLARRGADDGGAGAGAGSRWDSGKSIKDDAEAAGTEVELGTVLANVHALSATAAGLEAQLRQLVAAQAAAADRAP